MDQTVVPGRRKRRPRRPARTRTHGWPAPAAAARGPAASSARRRRSHLELRAAGRVETWVLRRASRRRWKAAPRGRATGLVPYQEQTRAVPSWASSPSDAARPGSRWPRRPGRRPGRRSRRPPPRRCRPGRPPGPRRPRRRPGGPGPARPAPPPRPGQQQRRTRPDRAQAHDNGRLPQPGRGVQADLEGGLDHRVQGGGPRVQVADRDGVPGVDDEPVLVRVEGEDALALWKAGAAATRPTAL